MAASAGAACVCPTLPSLIRLGSELDVVKRGKTTLARFAGSVRGVSGLLCLRMPRAGEGEGLPAAPRQLRARGTSRQRLRSLSHEITLSMRRQLYRESDPRFVDRRSVAAAWRSGPTAINPHGSSIARIAASDQRTSLRNCYKRL
eukprot:1155871-Pleurochrysis_carterae.AAC.2